MFTLAFWKDAAERAGRTGLQALLPLLLASSTDLLHIDWRADLAVALGAALASLGTSVGAAFKGGTISPASLVKSE